MKYSRYPAYTSDRKVWGDDHPTHWKVHRLRFVCIINPSKSEIADLPSSTEVSFVPMEDVGEYGGIRLETTKALEEVVQGYTYFRDGDVVLAKITPCFENGKGALAENLVAGIAFGTTELHVLRPRLDSVDSKFLFYVSISAPFRKLGEGEMYGAGGQKRVPNSFIENFKQPFPPLKEQRILAAFLDQETAKIDTLIAKQERLIATLQEKRQALISHAVTKGLNPNAPMKDSGIEGLGEIPAHWGVAAIWMLFRLGRGRVISNEEILDHPGPYPVYSSQTEKEGVMGYLDTFDLEGDYITWTTDGANAGTVFYRSGRFNCTNVCGTLFPSRYDIDLQFFRHAINNATNRFVRQDINPKLMNNVMAGIRIQMPPLPEQSAIFTFINQETIKIDALIGKASAAIERLQERRTALISAAVTGKIDVRAAMD